MINVDVKLVRFVLEDNGFKKLPTRNCEWSILWHGGAVRQETYKRMNEFQKVNHMPKTSEITRKDNMYKNLVRM